MNNKLVKKIQFGGWTKQDYKYIRRKINSFDEEKYLTKNFNKHENTRTSKKLQK